MQAYLVLYNSHGMSIATERVSWRDDEELSKQVAKFALDCTLDVGDTIALEHLDD